MFCNYTSHWYIIFRNCSASVPYKSAIILEVLLRLNVFLQFHHMTNHNHSSLDEFHGGLNTEFQYFVLVLFFNAFLYSNLLEGSFQFCWLCFWIVTFGIFHRILRVCFVIHQNNKVFRYYHILFVNILLTQKTFPHILSIILSHPRY